MNNIDLNGRTAIVTGGADGIGGSITERFLASGASVIMWDISQDNLDAKLAASAAGDSIATFSKLIWLTANIHRVVSARPRPLK